MKKLLTLVLALIVIVSLPSLAQKVNMKRYITLTVNSDDSVFLDFAAEKENTPILVVSGDNKMNLKVGTEKAGRFDDKLSFSNDGKKITIY